MNNKILELVLNFLKKNGGWITSVILVIILLFSLQKCNNVKKDAEADANLYKKLMTGKIAEFNSFKTKTGATINYQEQNISSQKTAIEQMVSEKELKDKGIKILVQQLKAKELILATHILIPFDDTNSLHPIIIEREGKSVTANCLVVPYPFSRTDSNLVIKGIVDTNGILFDSISFRNEPKFTVGIGKEPGFKNWFKPAKATVYYENNNPYAQPLAITNVTVRQKEKFYDKKWFWFVLGGISHSAIIIGVYQGIKK